jgi:TRAP transporter TAXI family solute receptor
MSRRDLEEDDSALDWLQEPSHAGRRVVLAVLIIVLLAALGAWFLQSTIPRRIVIASGARDGMYHQYAVRYRDILARDGVKVEERITGGADENARLLLDPKSGVTVAFMQGGVVSPAQREKLVMIAALYYEPMWIFYRGANTPTRLDELRYRRIAIGGPGSGTRSLAEPLFAANNVDATNTQLMSLGGIEALRALQDGKIDAAVFVGPVESPAIWQALHDPDLRLVNLKRADAYARRYPSLRTLVMPAGTIDFPRDIPLQEVKLLGTKAMLVARDDLPPAIIDLLLDAAREIHGAHGYFEADDEFPNTTSVDLPVSADAVGHQRFGPSLLHRYLPFFMATYVERLIVLLIPLLVIIVPVMNFLPQFLRWRVRSRIYRWYVKLARLDREVRDRNVAPDPERWLAALDSIEQAVSRLRTPPSFASEAYTLREHVALVREMILARSAQASSAAVTGE